MLKKSFLILLITCLQFLSKAAEIKIEGIYTGENLYVMNPFASSGSGFCIYEVTVNGRKTADEINSSAFEINLSVYKFKFCDKVKIIIKHTDNCTPKILNPEVLNPRSTFKIRSITVNKKGYLSWATTGEQGVLPYIVEQYRWKKWVKIGKISGTGKSSINYYKIKINLHSGKNRFRVKQIDNNKKSKFSPDVWFTNLSAEITFKPGAGKKTSKKIVFSAPTKYEIYDYYGNLKKIGNGKEINILNFKSGSYFLNYDNKTEVFIKK